MKIELDLNDINPKKDDIPATIALFSNKILLELGLKDISVRTELFKNKIIIEKAEKIDYLDIKIKL